MIWTALIMGLLGSLHCAGMCGPLILALPNHQSKLSDFIFSQLTYHTGRIFTYMLLGAITAGFAATLRFAGLQQWVSIVSGVTLLFLSLRLMMPSVFQQVKPLKSNLIMLLKQRMVLYFKKAGIFNRFVLGSLNGLLPCGLVYIALASANINSSFQESLLFMGLFGLGTIPALLLIGMTKRLNLFNSLKLAYKYYPYAVALLSILLILRGLNLGIPYISPAVDFTCGNMKCCHN